MAYRVDCVNIDEGSEYDDCRCVEELGIPNESGGINLYTPRRIHERIEEEEDHFFIEHEDERTFLRAAEKEGTKYVRTERNDTPDDNLLEQDPCP